MGDNDNTEDLADSIREEARINSELAYLFNQETVDQARLIDVVNLNLNEAMTASISAGVTRLKQLRNNPEAQRKLIQAMTTGERLLLCMWILDMDLLEKIQSRPNPG